MFDRQLFLFGVDLDDFALHVFLRKRAPPMAKTSASVVWGQLATVMPPVVPES